MKSSVWGVAAVLVLVTCALSAEVWGQNTPENRVVCSDDPAIYAIQQCGGIAGKFEITNGSNNKVALMGVTSGKGGGLYGKAISGIYGVLGESNNIGVYGKSALGYGGKFEITSGSNNRVALMGVTSGTGGGVYGKAISGIYGVLGESNNIGVYGKSALGRAGIFEITSASNSEPALVGATSGSGPGVYATSTTGSAAQFEINNPNSFEAVIKADTYGWGHAGAFVAWGSGDRSALFAWTNRTGGLAFHALGKAQIDGDAYINGTLSKRAGSFKIDHPLDPENKYLYHSFVESPDMMNVYNGNVILDSNGEAWVELPEWFDALNKDFRYQLTAIGAPALLYVAEEIAGNEFKIAGGQPGMKVSWQVTGIRQDAYANAHRIPVEEEKPPAERGTYLNPELFGQPVSRSTEWSRYSPEVQKALLSR